MTDAVIDTDRQRVLDAISREELAELTRQLIDIPSPTGAEREIGQFILDWYAANGLHPIGQVVDVDRLNAVGVLRGTGGGTSLMINGHLDTSFTGTDEDQVLGGQLSTDDLRGEIRDGKVFGLGASNMKCGLAAFMIGAAAIRRAGVQLKGDLILAAVAGEISRTPIEEFESGRYRGEGVGTRHLLTHGVQSDYAICADGSALEVIWTQTGVAQFRLQTFGRTHSAWGITREKEPPFGSNAILQMTRLVQRIDDWAERFERDAIYESANGPIIPKVTIGAIRGGAPYRANYYPGVCSLYVDVRFGPQLRPLQVERELRAALADAGVEYELQMYRSMMGYEAEGAEPVIDALESSYRSLYGEPTPAVTTGRSSIWTDTNIYNEMGIPCVKFGPRGKRAVRAEQVEIEEIYRAACVYAMTALQLCNAEPPDAAG
jgi:acetylornithine deacetylase/succinyl-diaminopimelate desuccinylase-like protein